jgi:hypothetical protein
MYVMGSVAAMVEVPAPDADPGLAMVELQLCLMVRTPASVQLVRYDRLPRTRGA